MRARSTPARHENITSTEKYMTPVAGMNAVKASDVELVALQTINTKHMHASTPHVHKEEGKRVKRRTRKNAHKFAVNGNRRCTHQ